MWGLIENEKKKKPRNICKRTLDKGFERDWSVGLGAMLDYGHTENKKNIFLVSGIFREKSIVVARGRILNELLPRLIYKLGFMVFR